MIQVGMLGSKYFADQHMYSKSPILDDRIHMFNMVCYLNIYTYICIYIYIYVLFDDSFPDVFFAIYFSWIIDHANFWSFIPSIRRTDPSGGLLTAVGIFHLA